MRDRSTFTLEELNRDPSSYDEGRWMASTHYAVAPYIVASGTWHADATMSMRSPASKTESMVAGSVRLTSLYASVYPLSFFHATSSQYILQPFQQPLVHIPPPNQLQRDWDPHTCLMIVC
jgi:hypothetical protein